MENYTIDDVSLIRGVVIANLCIISSLFFTFILSAVYIIVKLGPTTTTKNMTTSNFHDATMFRTLQEVQMLKTMVERMPPSSGGPIYQILQKAMRDCQNIKHD